MERVLKIPANGSPGPSEPKNVNKAKNKTSKNKIKSEIVFSELEATDVAGQGEHRKKADRVRDGRSRTETVTGRSRTETVTGDLGRRPLCLALGLSLGLGLD